MNHLCTQDSGMNVEMLDHNGTAEVIIDHQYGGPSDLREIAGFLMREADELAAFRSAEDLKAKMAAAEAKKFKASEIVPGFVYEAHGTKRIVVRANGDLHGVDEDFCSAMSHKTADGYASELNKMLGHGHVRKLS